jgi:hypothetical protein
MGYYKSGIHPKYLAHNKAIKKDENYPKYIISNAMRPVFFCSFSFFSKFIKKKNLANLLKEGM